MEKRTLRMLLLSLALWTLPTLVSGQEDDRSSRVILVSGATGTQGGAVARALVSYGYTVRGLTRDPNSEASRILSALGVQMVRGNFDEPASLDDALEGVYGAFSVQQYRGVGVDGEIRQSKAFADAAKRAGIEHFVYTSVIYAQLGTGVPQFESKREIEGYVRSLDIPYSIVRPSGFMSNLEGVREAVNKGIYRTPFPPEFAPYFIAPADIGHFVVEAFEHPDVWIGRELDIAGEQLSYIDLAATISRQLGRDVVYEQIPWEEYIASATSVAISRETWYLQNPVVVDMDGLHREFPWLLSVEDYLINAGWDE